MSHDPLVQMADCLFKCGKRHVVVENLAGGFEPARKGEMFLGYKSCVTFGWPEIF